jgi:hypothetical protein
MADKSIRVGDVEVIALSDGVYHPNLATYFPGHGPETGRTILSSLMRMGSTGSRGISAAT